MPCAPLRHQATLWPGPTSETRLVPAGYAKWNRPPTLSRRVNRLGISHQSLSTRWAPVTYNMLVIEAPNFFDSESLGDGGTP
jgi:hypothetical protein